VAVVPVVDAGLGNSAYVVDLGDGGALVVDPERDPRRYLDVRIVDVRQRHEHEAGHVVSSANIELGTLTTAPEQVAAGPVLLHCGHSERAMSAASLLERAGHTEVAVLDGGPTELAAAGHGLEAGA
jgi:hydroxyacylglutathione hydrolase